MSKPNDKPIPMQAGVCDGTGVSDIVKALKPAPDLPEFYNEIARRQAVTNVVALENGDCQIVDAATGEVYGVLKNPANK